MPFNSDALNFCRCGAIRTRCFACAMLPHSANSPYSLVRDKAVKPERICDFPQCNRVASCSRLQKQTITDTPHISEEDKKRLLQKSEKLYVCGSHNWKLKSKPSKARVPGEKSHEISNNEKTPIESPISITPADSRRSSEMTYIPISSTQNPPEPGSYISNLAPATAITKDPLKRVLGHPRMRALLHEQQDLHNAFVKQQQEQYHSFLLMQRSQYSYLVQEIQAGSECCSSSEQY